MTPESTLLLRRSEIASLLTTDDYIGAVEEAFAAHGRGASLATGLLHIDSHGGSSTSSPPACRWTGRTSE